MKRDLAKIIDEAYDLYMPQVRYEIEEFYDFVCDHYGFTKKSEPYNVLEIGTKFGGTLYLWCTMNQSSGLNISIDMNDGGLHGGINEQKMDERDEWFKERFSNCKFIRGDSHDRSTENKFLDTLDPDLMFKTTMIRLHTIEKYRMNKLDFLFIDGDHTYEGVKRDFEMYSPFVKKGGIIAFHDIKNTQKHRDRRVEVAKLWNEITDLKLPKHPNKCSYGGRTFEFVEFVDNSEDWGGIGVLNKI